MFSLFSWDKYKEKLPNPLILSYPAAEMRTGDFSRLPNSAGQPIVIYDPTTGHVDSTGAFIRNPFPNNIIPHNRINPIPTAVTSLMPLPTTSTPRLPYNH